MATILIQKTKLHQHDNDSFNSAQSVLFFFFFLYNISDCCTQLQQLGLMTETCFYCLSLSLVNCPWPFPPKANDDFWRMGLKKIISAHLRNFGVVKLGFIKETLSFLLELTSLNQFFLNITYHIIWWMGVVHKCMYKTLVHFFLPPKALHKLTALFVNPVSHVTNVVCWC